MTRHPGPRLLDGFLKSTLSEPELLQVVTHLLLGCKPCRRLLMKKGAGLLLPGLPEFKGSGWQYGAALAEGERWLRRKARGRDQAPLLKRTPGEEVERFYELLEESRKERYRDPGKMLKLAMAAQWTFSVLREDDFLPGAVDDLCARGCANLANAYRVNDDFAQAQTWFNKAYLSWTRGTRNEGLLAYITDFHASFNTARGNFEKAFKQLDFVYMAYLGQGERHLAGRALVKKGMAKNYDNDPEEAMDLIEEGLTLIEPARDRELHLGAVHNLLWLFSETGEHAQGRRLLAEHKVLYVRHADPLNLVKLRWLEGRIAAGLGEREEAEAAFRQVKGSFLRRKMGLDAALVSLDLAMLWAGQGRLAEIAGLALQMIAVFERLHLQREPIAVWILVERAARQERATVAFLRHSAERLSELLRPRQPARGD